MEKVTVRLSQEIEAHGEKAKELNFRQPVGKDIRNHGFPFYMDEKGALHFDSKAVAKYIEELADIPPSSVDTMTPADFQACSGVIMSFFGDVQKT